MFTIALLLHSITPLVRVYGYQLFSIFNLQVLIFSFLRQWKLERNTVQHFIELFEQWHPRTRVAEMLRTERFHKPKVRHGEWGTSAVKFGQRIIDHCSQIRTQSEGPEKKANSYSTRDRWRDSGTERYLAHNSPKHRGENTCNHSTAYLQIIACVEQWR